MAEIGISSYGAYIPMTRLAVGKTGERAVAGADEDALTMAVAAGVDCLRGLDRNSIDAVYFASTSYPYREKSGAALIARALDLRRTVATADFGASLRAGVSALLAAVDAVKAGSLRSILVIASDCRMGAPRSSIESQLGDAAAAFVVSDGAIATVEGVHTIAEEILDVWRSESDSFVQTWEERFVVDQGFRKNIVEVASGLREKMKSAPSDFDRVILYAPDGKSHQQAARALKVPPEKLQDPLFGKVGNAGTAFVPLQIAAALASIKSEQRILALAYGDGATAISLRATGAAQKSKSRGVAWHLEHKRPMDAGVYKRARHLEVEPPRPAGGISATLHHRDRDEDISLKAQRCSKCQTLQFPAQRVCFKCHGLDQFESVRLSDRRGIVMSYTFDYFHPSAETPTIAGIVDIDGARLYLMMADAKPDQLRCDLPVEFTFRRIHETGGKPNYFWKSTPVQSIGEVSGANRDASEAAVPPRMPVQ